MKCCSDIEIVKKTIIFITFIIHTFIFIFTHILIVFFYTPYPYFLFRFFFLLFCFQQTKAAENAVYNLQFWTKFQRLENISTVTVEYSERIKIRWNLQNESAQ